MHTQIKFGQSWQLGIAVLLTMVGVVAEVGDRTFAQSQIVPDNTLGTESSVVTPNVEINKLKSDRIDGGAIRGSNLFHSFQDFNVGEGGGVYFTNPQGIENILGRVTGVNRSEILGTLGVLGNANLFLLNPNGIVFGKNASLDIQGSFFATTAEAIALGKQGYFSATQPQQSSLLSVSPGALFFNQVASQPGNIINRGNLSAPKDLTLAGSNLDLQGQLYAGKNLSLQATDTAKIRDSEASPFLARSGGDLAIVGNQAIDILALNHPAQTSFVSGGNLSLIGDGMISGDARFSSGGSFSIQNLSGGLANFVSKYDPIISSNGDVDVAANYTGASLLVESKGNIRFGGDINITAPDTSALPPGQDTATLSKSTALIMRSGQNTLAYGGVSDGSLPAFTGGTVPEGITISGDVSLQRFNGAGGLVSLTTASGDVSTKGITTNGGAIDINSAGAINTNGQQLVTINDAQNGGDINLKANNDITTARLFSYSRSNGNVGNGGLINLETENGSITTDGLYSYSYSELSGSTGNAGSIFLSAFGNITTGGMNSEAEGTGNGGDITLTSNAGAIDTTKGTITSQIRQGSNGTGRAGTIVFTAKDNIQTALLNASAEKGDGGNIQLTSTNGAIDTSRGSLFANSQSGNGGAITFTAGGNITTGGMNSYSYSTSSNVANGGAISLKADNGSITTGNLDSSSDSRSGNAGNGGVINLQANNANITTGDLLSYSYSPVESGGNGGAITFAANGNITTGMMNSKAGGTGNGGDITLTSKAGAIDTTKGAIASEIWNNSGGTGRAGTIVFTAKDNIQTNELDASAETGDSGNIQLTSTNGAIDTTRGSLYADSRSGSTGKIQIEALSKIITGNIDSTINSPNSLVQGEDINLISEDGEIQVKGSINNYTFGASRAGNINIKAQSIFINPVQISSSTFQQGDAGNLNIIADDTVNFNDSRVFTTAEKGATGKAGNINITTKDLDVRNRSGLTTSTSGKADAGDVTINADKVFFDSSNVLSTATQEATGKGGNIKIKTKDLNVKNGSQLNTNTSGKADAGNVTIYADRVSFEGRRTETKVEGATLIIGNYYSGISTNSNGEGAGGSINITANSLDIKNGAALNSETEPGGQKPSGDINLDVKGTISIDGGSADSGASRITLGLQEGGKGSGGNLKLTAGSLVLRDGGYIAASTNKAEGNAGNINIKADSVDISGGKPSKDFIGGISTSTNNNFAAGNITVEANTLSLENGGRIRALSEGGGNAGSINIDITRLLSATDSNIVTSATESSGGAIEIEAGDIRLYGNSDIKTEVGSGTGKGGNITLTADSIFAFDDSDILAFASGGTGGKITFDTPAFFGQNYKQRSANTTNPRTLDRPNNRVDINASGAVSGVITLPDTSFIQNSLNQLPENLIDTSNLIANSCIARTSRQQQGSFKITGSGGLPTRPGDALMSTYTFGNVRSVSNADLSTNSTRRPWRKGDAIVEPQGVYRLSSGQLVLSRECH